MNEELLLASLASLVGDVPYLTTNLSNASALLYESMEDLNWAGFYLLRGEELWLGPFQGKPACVRIPIGKGVCGSAVKEGRTLLVPDVHAFPGHIACDGASRSEIVVPLRVNGEIVGVLDLDSPLVGRFTEKDQRTLEGFCSTLTSLIGGQFAHK